MNADTRAAMHLVAQEIMRQIEAELGDDAWIGRLDDALYVLNDICDFDGEPLLHPRGGASLH